MNNEQQTQQADDPSGDGWVWVAKGDAVREGDMWRSGACSWCRAERVGETVQYNAQYRRRIEPQQQQPQAANPDDPSGPGWRDVEPDEVLRHGDLFWHVDHWQATQHAGQPAVDERTYRRRIEPQQPSDSEPETVDDLRRRLAEYEVLVAEAEISGEQVNARLQQLREQARDLTRQTQVDALELQQLRGQVQTLTRERDRYRNQLAGAIEHGGAPEAQAQLVDRLQKWLRPVLEVVADHPEDASPLAVAVLGYLPGIASRLIEE